MSRPHVHAGTAFNFLENDEVKLTLTWGSEPGSVIEVPPTVCMTAGGGSCCFQFDMTAAGARALSKLLFDAAHKLDKATE